MSETEHLKSLSHQHVLAPEMRTADKAWAVAHKLLHKAAMRLRAQSCGREHRAGDWVCRARGQKGREPFRRPNARMDERDPAERVPG